ncbi:nucleoside-diphosphate kinase [Paenibacillus pasadenensis]|uniref:Nucleoside diphosphate kinase n=1 Tax=Paenibacillus pasadenensis TaxID=217090 RepID=A0A2N5N6L5_9BACL|nr:MULTISPECIES: nucleoside-diphosphate kinase [Paenibacillus]PLT45953.1 Nucleoside diphosphate kinase [Paenibacillus pasadenensis]QGG56368.1 nucleoside-diphosphate kinase [Paenibacillus sp. B01]
MSERAFVMIKPDGVRRGLIGEIVSRFEKKGLSVVKAELIQVSEATAKEHYGHLEAKPFFRELVDYITSGPSFAMIVEGTAAVKNSRYLIGATNPADAAPGTIRGDYGLDVSENVIHGSDSIDNARIEIERFFIR